MFGRHFSSVSFQSEAEPRDVFIESDCSRRILGSDKTSNGQR